MRRCAYSECGKEFEQVRSDQLYCCAKHRTYAYRLRARADKKLTSLDERMKQDTLIARLERIAPKTAARLSAFRDEHGRGCTEDAIKLALSAYVEAQQRQADNHKQPKRKAV